MNPSELREAIRDAIYDLDLRVDNGQAYIFDSDECEERILDAVIASLPVNDRRPPHTPFENGAEWYRKTIIDTLQQAKSKASLDKGEK